MKILSLLLYCYFIKAEKGRSTIKTLLTVTIIGTGLLGFFIMQRFDHFIEGGGMLLSMSICSRNGAGIPFLNALFTSASATCVLALSCTIHGRSFPVLGKALFYC